MNFKSTSICLGCLCLIIISIYIINKKTEKLLQIPNPLTEVKSIEEMKKYLGFDVPVIKSKDVESYIVIGENKYATHARIIYKDNSSFEMEKGTNKNVSGIYGGELKQKETINGQKVSIYTMEDIIYANWSDSEYSYSYSIKNGNIDKLISDIKLIK